MTVRELVREAIKTFDRFTNRDIYQAVRHQIQHLKEPALAVVSEMSMARERGEIVQVGKKRIGPKAVVTVWRKTV